MGQQQLLLVILVTIIVGIATVVAINTFGSAADSANIDAVRQDVASIAASAQGFYMKPTMLGGGGNSFAPSGTSIDFQNLAFGGTISPTDDLIAWNENGTYIISGASGTEFTVTAHPSSCTGYTQASGGCDAADQLVATVEPDNMSFTN